MDHYQILGVSRVASSREITAAYRKLALQYHPDRNKSPVANDMMLKINTAYGILSDPRKRKEYDYSVHMSKAVFKREPRSYTPNDNTINSILSLLIPLVRTSITNILRISKTIIKLIQRRLS